MREILIKSRLTPADQGRCFLALIMLCPGGMDGSRWQGPITSHMLFAILRSVLTQAELGRPHDFVLIQRYHVLLGVLALERFVKCVGVS